MNTPSILSTQVQPETPLAGFSRCHLGILTQLEAAAQLPELMLAAERARRVAADTLTLFESSVIEHHADEEGDLFPAVQRSAAKGAESELIAAMVQRLTREHREIEALWAGIKPAVKTASHGRPAEVDVLALAQLVQGYAAHALFEEREFLPLAQEILGRNGNHLAALGIALHMRHVPQPFGYI
jgi:hemerythrin-like domain-containing protein